MNTTEEKKEKKHIHVVAGVIMHQNQILCMERPRGKYDYVSFKFEFPGGKIEAGESEPDALNRELREEMEMKVDIEQKLMVTTHEYPDFIVTMNVFLCKAQNPVFVMKEHNSFVWLPAQKLPTLEWAAADVPVVEKLMEMFR